MNCEAYSSFSSLGSDHRAVTATVRLSLRAPRQKMVKREKYLWNQLVTDTQLQQQYAVEIRNKFQGLLENEDITAGYERFIEANQAASEICLQKVPRKRRKEMCLDPRIGEARKAMTASYKDFVADRRRDGKR